jgi:hypothetical protein
MVKSEAEDVFTVEKISGFERLLSTVSIQTMPWDVSGEPTDSSRTTRHGFETANKPANYAFQSRALFFFLFFFFLQHVRHRLNVPRAETHARD